MSRPPDPIIEFEPTPGHCVGLCCAGCHHYAIGEDFEAMKLFCWLDDKSFSKKAVRQCLIDADIE